MNLTVFLVPVSLVLLGLSLLTSCASPKPFSRTGIVQQLEPGKDGYTASLRDRHGIDFDALVSRVRLQQDYRVLKVGDRVKVVGDTIHLNQRIRVLVTQIR